VESTSQRNYFCCFAASRRAIWKRADKLACPRVSLFSIRSTGWTVRSRTLRGFAINQQGNGLASGTATRGPILAAKILETSMNWKELPPARKLDGISLGKSRQSSFHFFAIVRQRFNCRRKYLFGLSCRRIRLSRSDRVINVSH
jgi:hypothetical protein